MFIGYGHMLGYAINGIGCRFRHVVDNDIQQQRQWPMEQWHELHGILWKHNPGSGDSRLTFRYDFYGNANLHVERCAKFHVVFPMGQRFNRKRG
jgi:hypothetical protein